jgi:hypothetical protein
MFSWNAFLFFHFKEKKEEPQSPEQVKSSLFVKTERFSRILFLKITQDFSLSEQKVKRGEEEDERMSF